MTAGCARSVRRFAMGPCVQMCKPKFLKMLFLVFFCKFDDMWFCCYCCLVERVFLKMIHLQDKILKQRQVWITSRATITGPFRILEAHRLRAFEHFRPVSPTTICSFFFFSQSITGASIIPNFCVFFCWTPPPTTPEKALKNTDSPIFPGELSQFDMDALKSVPRKQGHSLNPRWISLNRKIWLGNLLALDGHTVLFTLWCVQSWDEKIFLERNCNYSHL